MYIKVCDLCGKRINDNTILGRRYELVRCVGTYETKMHICDDCMKRITSEIRTDVPQTESTGSPIGDYRDGVGAWQTDRMTEEEFDTMIAKGLLGQTDCGWGEPNE